MSLWTCERHGPYDAIGGFCPSCSVAGAPTNSHRGTVCDRRLREMASPAPANAAGEASGAAVVTDVDKAFLAWLISRPFGDTDPPGALSLAAFRAGWKAAAEVLEG